MGSGDAVTGAEVPGVLGSPIEGRVVIGPNWFASVMGTGIVAVAGATLPIGVPGALTTAAWLLATVILLGLLILMPLNWIREVRNPAGHR